MMGTFIGAVLALGFLGMAPQFGASSSGWESDYGRALAATRQVHRPLLVVLDEPAVPEHRIEPVRFLKDQAVNTDAPLLEPYELCHVDASTVYGKKVAQAFNATQFPFTAIIDKSGQRIIYQNAGPMSRSDWQSALTEHSDGELPTQAVPASYSLQPPQQMYFGPSYCPSCQGW